MTTPCSKESEIANLVANQGNIMDMMKETRDDVKDIKKFLFEGGLEIKMNTKADKTSVTRIWNIIWAIIGFGAVTIGTVLVAMVKYFLSLNIK